MKKFYPEMYSLSSSDPIQVGGFSLQGEYVCDYCGEEYAQRNRFQVLVEEEKQEHLVAKKSFCTPECCAAYNLYFMNDESKSRRRHLILEQRHARKIVPAPPPRVLIKYDKVNGLYRSKWLPVCRDKLQGEDIETARKELYIQKKDLLAL